MDERVVTNNNLIANSENVVQGATFRISVLTERLIRLEYHPNGIFNDYESTLVKFRNFPKVNFQKQEDNRYLVIKTKYFTLSYTKEKSFDAGKLMPMANLKVDLIGTDRSWYYNHPEVKNYKGNFIASDGSEDDSKPRNGLYSIDGFASLDDSNSYGVLLNYEFSLKYNEKLYIIYKYNLNWDSREILYFQESIIITPIIYSLPCDYKFIIPDGYKYIGTKNGYLTKESDRIYKFTGDCTSHINEILRFSPEKVWWKAMNEYSLETSTKFEDTALLSFPRLYRGGKLKNANYEISSIDDEAFNEEDNIFNDNYLEVELQANDKAKVGVKIETTFLNNLNEEFKVSFPENQVNLTIIK